LENSLEEIFGRLIALGGIWSRLAGGMIYKNMGTDTIHGVLFYDTNVFLFLWVFFLCFRLFFYCTLIPYDDQAFFLFFFFFWMDMII
jgi:hypothetical protein